MPKDKYEQNDPTWNRTNRGKANLKKKRKMCSRSSVRLMENLAREKREADRRKGKVPANPYGIDHTTCATRTVELPSTRDIGNERTKLLFMLAIGLTPKLDKPKNHFPLLRLEKLDPVVEAEAKARTRDIIYKIFEQRKRESLARRASEKFPCQIPNKVPKILPRPPPTLCPPPVSRKDNGVPFVDLVSSEDEVSTSSDEADDEPQIINDRHIFCHHVPPAPPKYLSSLKPILPEPHHRVPSYSLPGEKVMHSSQPWQPNQQRKLFKPIISNQNNGIFRNWKPENLSRLINMSLDKTSSDSSPEPIRSESKISSLRSVQTPPSFIVRDFQCKLSSGGTYNKSTKISRDDPPSSPEVEYIIPDTITLD